MAKILNRKPQRKVLKKCRNYTPNYYSKTKESMCRKISKDESPNMVPSFLNSNLYWEPPEPRICYMKSNTRQTNAQPLSIKLLFWGVRCRPPGRSRKKSEAKSPTHGSICLEF